MSQFVSAMDKMPKLVKVLLALPALDIVWVIYRICRSISKNNMLGIVLGVVLLIVGIPFLWLIDIITIVATDKVLWID